MGQGECLEYLEERKGEWIKTKEIAKGVDRSNCNVSVPLSGLYKQGDVDRRMKKQAEGYEWRAA